MESGCYLFRDKSSSPIEKTSWSVALIQDDRVFVFGERRAISVAKFKEACDLGTMLFGDAVFDLAEIDLSGQKGTMLSEVRALTESLQRLSTRTVEDEALMEALLVLGGLIEDKTFPELKDATGDLGTPSPLAARIEELGVQVSDTQDAEPKGGEFWWVTGPDGPEVVACFSADDDGTVFYEGMNINGSVSDGQWAGVVFHCRCPVPRTVKDTLDRAKD